MDGGGGEGTIKGKQKGMFKKDYPLAAYINRT
jgi:hypothetical protein